MSKPSMPLFLADHKSFLERGWSLEDA
uniref:Uncharacterized protein n=1 Tax=Arundo donax TaxID=35708 RepID=A0A0A8Z9S2_ARUDO